MVNTIASDAAAGPTPNGPLVSAWLDWLDRGTSSDYSDLFSRCGPAILSLAETGVLPNPTATAIGLPDWVKSGDADTNLDAQVAAMLATVPEVADSFHGWVAVADWWARVRWLCADDSVSGEIVAEAWSQWAGLDAPFRLWLRQHYASELGRSYLPPRAVDKIAPFLAHQLRQRDRPQVLIVMDGMGLAQWNHLRAETDLVEAESHVLLAGIPTITRISRQSIFSGRLPNQFASRLTSPAEEKLWKEFWSSQGVPDNSIHYLATNSIDQPSLAVDGRVFGLVVNRVDDAMHGVGGFGDVGFRRLVEQLGLQPFLRGIIGQALDRDWDVWVTADHGNLECTGLHQSIPRQGVRVRSRGKRVWTYETQALREAASVPGDAWDPPGYPQSAGYPLFATGRSCYERDAVLVSHGGLSMDEVFVPLVRVTS